MQATVILSFIMILSFVSSSLSAPSSSQCGKLNITCPFRLKGSHDACKNGSSEVVCEGSNTFWYNKDNKYRISKIYPNNQTFHLVNDALNSSSCALPNQTSLFDRYWEFRNVALIVYLREDYCHFLNCSRQLNDSQYIPVPCLSINDYYRYVQKTGYYLSAGDIPNYCRNFARILTSENLTVDSEVFTILQHGFLARRDNFDQPADHDSVKECIRKFKDLLVMRAYGHINTVEALLWPINAIYAELSMLACLYSDHKNHNHIIFGLDVLLTICVNIAIPLLVGRIIFAPLVIYISLMYKYWKSIIMPADLIEAFLRRHTTFSVRRYDFSDIIIITSQFRQKLGHGGFGAVYIEKDFNGSLVAVKMLSDSKFDGDDFINEVGTIGKIHHTNIVQLVGFCSEGSKRALIYEYMPNGSLDKYIFCTSNGTNLAIEKRKEIAIGIARGIDYLHRGCDMQILHFDIKPHNILLDHNLTPKISDFGLAKLYPREYNTAMVIAARGTMGYIAPELVSRNFGTISHKADVYSFDMLLLELAGGRKNVDPEAGNDNQVYYPSWIYDQLTQRENDEVSNVTVEIDKIEGNLAKVGLWCIQSKPSNRPSMSRVIDMLQMEEINLEMPPKPFANITAQETPTMGTILESGSVELSEIFEEISHN